MSAGLHSGSPGLSFGVGLWAGVTGLSEAGGLSPATGGLQPWLVLDFVGAQNASLSLDFTARPEGEYRAFTTDPSQPTSGFAYYQVWT